MYIGEHIAYALSLDLREVPIEREPAVEVLHRNASMSDLYSCQKKNDTYLSSGLVVKDRLDLRLHLGRELGQDLERLEVVEDLLGFARTEDDRRRGRLRREPGECEVRDLAVQFYRQTRFVIVIGGSGYSCV